MKKCLKRLCVADVVLSLSARFTGYLFRVTALLNKRRFSAVSYSPVTALLAERLTEAAVAHPFQDNRTVLPPLFSSNCNLIFIFFG
ncbi:MAG: hypothetical protein ACP5IG_00620 [Candidatus Micrarchaeia archaeon]